MYRCPRGAARHTVAQLHQVAVAGDTELTGVGVHSPGQARQHPAIMAQRVHIDRWRRDLEDKLQVATRVLRTPDRQAPTLCPRVDRGSVAQPEPAESVVRGEPVDRGRVELLVD